MHRGLAFSVLWPPTLLLFMLSTCLFWLASAQRRTTTTATTTETVRRNLDQAMLRLTDRHIRSMRKIREALVLERIEDKAPRLNWTTEHYNREIDENLAAVRLVSQKFPPFETPRQQRDLALFSTQLDRIGSQSVFIGQAMEAIVNAADSEDPEALRSAQEALEKADRDMHAYLRQAQTLMQRFISTPPDSLDAQWSRWALVFSLGLVCLAPLAILAAFYPLRRIRRLSLGKLPKGNMTHEEQTLTRTFQDLQNTQDALRNRAEEAQRETERFVQAARRAERELALLKLYNDNLMNSLQSAILVTEPSKNILAFNRRAEKLLQIPPSAAGQSYEGQPIFQSLLARIPQASLLLETTLSKKKEVTFAALPLTNLTPPVLVDLRITPYLDESGASRGLLWVADDVSHANALKNQLFAAERLAAVGRIAAQVAHEIRNPLSAIGLNAELIEEEVLEHGSTESRTQLRAIYSEVERLTHITEGYLQLARLPEPHFQNTNINQVVADLASLVQEELHQAHIELRLDLGTPPPHVWADPGQLRQALLNIVRNSREAMTSGGTLQISTSEGDGCGLVHVVDSGPGVPETVLPRIFEPFFTTKNGGTGLGLSLTKQIIEEHHGSIALTNAHPHGTRVLIELPSQAS